jgi:hypothetical protein
VLSGVANLAKAAVVAARDVSAIGSRVGEIRQAAASQSEVLRSLSTVLGELRNGSTTHPPTESV